MRSRTLAALFILVASVPLLAQTPAKPKPDAPAVVSPALPTPPPLVAAPPAATDLEQLHADLVAKQIEISNLQQQLNDALAKLRALQVQVTVAAVPARPGYDIDWAAFLQSGKLTYTKATPAPADPKKPGGGE